MWMRFRRYRVFLIFAIFLTFAFYHLTFSKNGWDKVVVRKETSITHEAQDYSSQLSPAEDQDQALPTIRGPASPQVSPQVKQAQKELESTTSSTLIPKETVIPPTLAPVEPTKISESANTIPEIVLPDREPPPKTLAEKQKEINELYPGESLAIPDKPSKTARPTKIPTSVIHWIEQPEHFPVPIESIIQLPSGKPISIPKIQYDFPPESAEAKASRERKRDSIKEEAMMAWEGYRTQAWMHDEVRPVSGKFKDPFCGWAATLVDSLDTLWIMDMIPEFEEAVKAVNLIDFTTSPRADIPMFETTIRYLGGLLAAYDISGAKYRSLLDKAVELAEILYGAFDTPNRMPLLYYQWKPALASQPHRATTKVGTAELGSMAMEFTRLAQLTKEPRYYDAVARITDALEEFQDRGEGIPGVFPNNFDASGCNWTISAEPTPVEAAHGYEPDLPRLPKKTNISGALEKATPSILEPQVIPEGGAGLGRSRIKGWDDNHTKDKQDSETAEVRKPAQEMKLKRMKRQLYDPSLDAEPTVPPKSAKDISSVDTGPYNGPASQLPTKITRGKPWDCVPQGLKAVDNKFSMGGGQDSTYEYFPKQYVLLGGLEDKYRTMYLKVIDAVRENMLFRPMIPDNRNILFSGALLQSKDGSLTLDAESTHLTCFIGGMVGMGAKLFGIEGDMDIAKRLTDGCVWAYESMPSGIMAEGSRLLPCTDMNRCHWNETTYNELLDPVGAAQREQNRAEYFKNKAIGMEIEAQQKALVAKTKAQSEQLALEGKAEAAAKAVDDAEEGVANRLAHAAQTEANSEHLPAQEEAERLVVAAKEAAEAKDDSSAEEAALLLQKAKEYTAVSGKMAALDVPESRPTENMLDVIHKRQIDATEEKVLPITHDLASEAYEISKSTHQQGLAIANGETVSGGGVQKSRIPIIEEGFQTKLEPTAQELENEAINPHGSPDRTLPDDFDPIFPILPDVPTITGQEPLNPEDDPLAPFTHEQYVLNRIKNEGLPTGYTAVNRKEYILRPEAIESVFYMYRITGDPIWQDKGWKMWVSIIKAVKTNYGHTAISDVTLDTKGDAKLAEKIQNDSMESFWLAETLKYFYLLFSEPGLVDLDEWVLNTEAHPFRRPV